MKWPKQQASRRSVQSAVPQRSGKGTGKFAAHLRPKLHDCRQQSTRYDGGPEVRSASAASVEVHLDACAQFVERARNRLIKADEVLRQAQEDRAKFEQELREGEERLEQLRVEASEQMPPAHLVEADDVSNLERLVTALRNHVPFLEANKNDTWEGIEELWQLTREVEELIQGTGSLILRVQSQAWHRQSWLTQRSQPSWSVSLQDVSGWREWTRSPCSPSVHVS